MENPPKAFKIEKIEIIVNSKETQALLECINSLDVVSVSIGDGNNADIYAALGTAFDKVCLKKIKEKPLLICNSIEEEEKYQIMAREYGVRTPLSLISIDTNDGKYIIMERIEGYTVREVVNNKNLLSKNFNYDFFCKSLDDQITKMHNSGLYHRDLHDANVMIDKEGLPVIIDFGTAIEGTGSDSTYEELVEMFDQKTGRYRSVNEQFSDDLGCVKKIKSQLRSIS